MLLNKVGGVLIRRKGETDRKAEVPRWALSAVLYLGIAFLSVFCPFPPLGATGSIGSGEGLWEQFVVYHLLLLGATARSRSANHGWRDANVTRVRYAAHRRTSRTEKADHSLGSRSGQGSAVHLAVLVLCLYHTTGRGQIQYPSSSP